MSTAPSVRLKPGRDQPVRLRHPWILSGSVDRIEGDPEAGTTVRVISAEGKPLATGDFDPSSQIRVRLHTFGPEPPDPEEPWLEERLDRALRWRAREPSLADTDALRLVNAEADDLAGLVVDRYAHWLVLKAGTPAMLRRMERIAGHLEKSTGARGAWLRGVLLRETSGGRALFGEVPEDPMEIVEGNRRYRVDLRRGQKTGFYLDQRDSRGLVERLASGRRALDLYAYTGGFSLGALAGGAAATVAVESSEPAVRLLRENTPATEAVLGDVRSFLREDSRRFDLVVCDPPPLARRRREVPAACRAYKDLHLHLLRRVTEGAYLLTFTCSHHIDAGLFRKVVFGAATDAGAELQVLARLGAAADHPVALHHPQGEYLNGLLLRVVEAGS